MLAVVCVCVCELQVSWVLIYKSRYSGEPYRHRCLIDWVAARLARWKQWLHYDVEYWSASSTERERASTIFDPSWLVQIFAQLILACLRTN